MTKNCSSALAHLDLNMRVKLLRKLAKYFEILYNFCPVQLGTNAYFND